MCVVASLCKLWNYTCKTAWSSWWYTYRKDPGSNRHHQEEDAPQKVPVVYLGILNIDAKQVAMQV